MSEKTVFDEIKEKFSSILPDSYMKSHKRLYLDVKKNLNRVK